MSNRDNIIMLVIIIVLVITGYTVIIIYVDFKKQLLYHPNDH